MNNRRPTHQARDLALLIGLLAILAAESGAELTRHLSPNELGSYLIQLGATFFGAALAAAFGVWLFYFQGEKTEENRRQQLLEALIAELYSTRDRLSQKEATRIPDTNGGRPDIMVVLTHLEPTVCEEAIRSALLGHANTLGLTRLARLMREYTKEVDLLRKSLYGPESYLTQTRDRLAYAQAYNVKGTQQYVLLYCKTILEGFASQGRKLPPEDKLYSDPSKRVPENWVKPN